jgi:ABC-type uncharacterized transport system substrate-binding protein
MPWDENDPDGKRRYSAFTQALADLGWTDGRNVRLDVRWSSGDINQIRPLAQKLVGLQPDIIAANGTPATAAVLKVVPIIAPVHSDVEIEAAIIALGCEPRGGLVVMPDTFMNVHRAPIILAAARNKVPAVYGQSFFARDGGLLSHGVDQIETYRRAATYVDRILRGAKPGDLPVRFPTKFEMVVNLKRRRAGRGSASRLLGVQPSLASKLFSWK